MTRTLSPRLVALAASLLAGCAADRPTLASATPPDAEGAVRRGYTATQVNGRTLYCRTELVTGTLFRQKVCLTGEQLAAEERDSKATKESLRQPRGIDCSGRQGKCAGSD